MLISYRNVWKPQGIVMNGLMTREAAAEYLGVSPRTMGNWATQFDGPMYCRIGRRVYYEQTWLDNWQFLRGAGAQHYAAVHKSK